LQLLSLLQGKLVGASLFEYGLDRLVETLHPLPLRQGILNQLVLLLQLVDSVLPLLRVHCLPLKLGLEVADSLLLLLHREYLGVVLLLERGNSLICSYPVGVAIL
jgi:hypothetical protein